MLPQGCGLGSTATSCEPEWVLSVTPRGMDLPMCRHPCVPLVWAPVETPAFALVSRRVTVCHAYHQTPNPPLG